MQGSTIILELKHILQRHPDRITYMAELKYNSKYWEDTSPDVVVKCYSNRASRGVEAVCYQKLLPLQGKHVPNLVGSGTVNDEATLRCFALILAWVGEDLEGQKSIFPPHVWKQVREIVIKMHELGVVHWDLEFRNMTFDQSNGCIFLYDFSNALTSEGLGPKAFAEARARELDRLDNLIADAS
jgi:hypothetical protein